MDSALLTVGKYSRETGLNLQVRNLGSPCGHRITVYLDGSAVGEATVELKRSEVRSVDIPLDIRMGAPGPVSLRIRDVPVNGGLESTASAYVEVIPEGWYDTFSDDLVSRIAGEMVSSDLDRKAVSLGEDMIESYSRLADMEVTDDVRGRYIYVTGPEMFFGCGDGTRLDFAVGFMSEMCSRGYSCCIIESSGRSLVGVSERPGSSLLDGYTFVQPADSCSGVPFSVSRDMAAAFVRQRASILRRGKEYAFRDFSG